ncbi:MAG: isocitrate/isopropylmalate dehydrogenase family protein [Gemmatimonadales bacterium]
MIRVGLLPGDGVGPEVVREARRVLEAVGHAGLAELAFRAFPHGADHWLATGETLGDEAFATLRDETDAILLGAVGDPRVPDNRHAHDILLGLRFRLDLYINFRPARLRSPALSPLRRADRAEIDLVIFRENTEGAYIGAGGGLREGTPGEIALGENVATRYGVERIVRAAFEYAERTGRGRVTLADKANAIPSVYGLWRRVFGEIAAEHPSVEAETRYVDALAMELVRRPERFGVIVTDNLFGDILSDLAAELVGGMGLAPSANYRPGGPGLYEPVHGSAPDIAGRGEANPMAAILSAALLLEHEGAEEAARRVDAAVTAAIEAGVTTPDLGGTRTTQEVGEWIAGRIEE